MKRVAAPAGVVALVAVSALSAQETVVVRADGPPVWGESPGLVEEVRVGTLEGDERYAFGSVGGVAVTADGTIWVGDTQLHAIRRYDAEGRYIDQIGREGEGPGEFRYPAHIRTLPDGSVAVWDNGLIRVSRFSDHGAFLDSFRPSTFMIWSAFFESFEVDREGNLYVIAMDTPGRTRGPLPLRRWWIEVRPDGEVLDSIHVLPSDGDESVDQIRTLTVLSPLGYVVTGRADTYALDLHVAPDRTVRIERPWEPVPYQRGERAERERRERVFAERNGRSPRRVADHKPPFYRFKADVEGRLWVEMYARGYVEPETPGEAERRERYDGVPQQWRQPLVYEVVEPTGRYLGRFRFPNRQTEVMVARDRLVWVVETGPFDEQYVVRYRIEPGG